MLLLICLLTLARSHIQGYQTPSQDRNFASLKERNFKLHNDRKHSSKSSNSKTSNSETNRGNEIDFNFLSNLHKNAFEHPELQLHLPPTSNALPKLNRHLSSSSLFNLTSNARNDDPNVSSYKEDNLKEGKSLESDNSEITGEEEEEATALDSYLDGPLDVLKMVGRGQIPEYRHTLDNLNRNHKDALPTDHKGPNLENFRERGDLTTSCRWERPCDVFVLNYALIDLNVREYVYLSAKVIERSPAFGKLDSRARELINSISKSHLVPNWLLTLFRYIAPVGASFSDFVLLTFFLVSKWAEVPDGELNSLHSEFTQNEKTDKAKDGNNLERLRLLTKNCDPNRLVDFFARDHYNLNFDLFALFDWKSNGIHSQLANSFANLNLNRAFLRERAKLRRDRSLRQNLVKFRNNANSHVSYNFSLVQLLNYHLHYFRMPVYLVSDLESVREARRRLKLFGVRSNELLNVFQVRNSQHDSVPDNAQNSEKVDSLLLDLLNRLKLDARVPVHYFDNSLANLASLLSHPKLKNVRLYFADWGRSGYADKLRALYDDRLKYVKDTRSLVEFMATFSVADAREFSHGLRLRSPFEEHALLLAHWANRHS